MKKKIVTITLLICLLAIAITSACLTYFTDQESVDNVFTVGEVTITLDESKVTLDSRNHAVVGTERVTGDQNYGQLYPCQQIKKDPKITNTGSENAYVAAKVTITNQNGVTESNKDLMAALISGGLLADTENATVKTGIESGAYVIYILYHTEMTKDQSVVLFDTLSISKDYNNDQMAQLQNLNIHVDAYAVQSIGFDNAKDALIAAFPTALAALQQ